MSRKIIHWAVMFSSVFLLGCAGPLKDVAVVQNFDTAKYLGTWYEIARLDFRFERDLNNTTAQYSVLSDTRIRVINKGYNYKTQEWKQVQGKAKFKQDDKQDHKQGALLVSFFGPFYSSYNIVAIDSNYQYALITGRSTDYMWILSRTKTIPETVKTDYLNRAKALGFDTDALVWVHHD